MADNINMKDRLRSLTFDMREARDALRGKAIPKSLGRRVTRLCVIRGIRYHEQFAEHPDLEEMRKYVPEISRAINARAIMSNKIPSMTEARDKPYCIWHPQLATQDTYRKLWQQYPDMSYQIARACAVANYLELFLEMDLLPDVSVAEEARASGSLKIYEAIMQSPLQYQIMNDYTREVTLQDPETACLNDDTAVLYTLDITQGIRKPQGMEEESVFESDEAMEEAQTLSGSLSDDEDDLFPSLGFEKKIFNITEDMSVDELDSEDPRQNYLLELLSQPLPVHLPAGNKDILILMAAYYGNIERYARLRRPCMIKGEEGCLVRGVYHNTLFALWCGGQFAPGNPDSADVKMAVYARMIMNNDLSRITNLDTRQPFAEFLFDRPYLIWFPTIANPATYKFLASTVAEMRPSVLHAAVYTKDKTLFDWMLDELGVAPTLPALQEAKVQNRGSEYGPSYFVRRLEARSQELGIDLNAAPVPNFKMCSAQPVYNSVWLAKELMPQDLYSSVDDWGIYNGYRVDASEVEVFVSAPESWRPDSWKVELDYEDWPRRGSADN